MLCRLGPHAANGDVANKIGTYMLALAAHDNGVPFYPVVPTSTVDLSLAHGDLIPIEERNPQEVLGLEFEGQRVAPQNAKARNIAFDVTPARLVTGIVTENGVAYPPFEVSLKKMVEKNLDKLDRLKNFTFTKAHDKLSSVRHSSALARVRIFLRVKHGYFAYRLRSLRLPDDLPRSFQGTNSPRTFGVHQPFVSGGVNVQTARRHCPEHRLHHGAAWQASARDGNRWRGFRRIPRLARIKRRGYVPDEGCAWVFTASFFATTDKVSAQIASFYPGAMAHSATQSLKELDSKPDLVIVSPSSPDAMMKFPAECRELGIPYLYDPSQQVLRLEGEELARDMEGAYFLFCNDYEFGLISKKTGWSLDQILDHVKVLVITRGKDGADLYSDGNSVHIPTVPEDEVVDPPGWGMPSAADSSRVIPTASIGSCAARSARSLRYTALSSAARRIIPTHVKTLSSASAGILMTAGVWMCC
jgi:hypothetical protein